MIKLFNGQLWNLLQNNLSSNPEFISLSYAILQEKQRIINKAHTTRTLSVIDEVPEEIIDLLAVELRTPAYNENFPIKTKQTLIKGTLSFYKKLGTPDAVVWIINSIFGSGKIEEWFEYGGEAHHFRISCDDPSFIENFSRFMQMLNIVKRCSSWLDNVTLRMLSEMKLYTAAAVQEAAREYYRIGV